MEESSRRVWAIFDEILDRGPEGWEEHLTALCDGDQEVYRRAFDLLHAHWDQERLQQLTRAPVLRPEQFARALGLPTPPRAHVRVTEHPQGDALPQQNGASLVERLQRRLADLYQYGPQSGRYSVERLIGEGGMGEVYLVRDRSVGRTLAMKLAMTREPLAPGGTPPPEDAPDLARFIDEARVTGQLDHPAIVPVHDLGVNDEGGAFFTMRHVEGHDFSDVIASVHSGSSLDGQEWTMPRALEVILRVADAMAYAHGRGIVHCDLKPLNIRVGGFGAVYVLDWGIACTSTRVPASEAVVEHANAEAHRPLLSHAEALATAKERGRGIGTPEYMPPEQAAGSGAALDPRTDVYALGATLYHLLAGHAPYHEDGQQPTEKAFERAPAPLHALGKHDIPSELESITSRAMQRAITARYPDMASFASDVRAYLEDRVVRAHETGAWAEAKKWVRRNRPLATSLATAALLLVAGLTTFAAYSRIAAERAGQVLRLSALQDHEDLIAQAGTLWPPHPENMADYRDWITDAQTLVADLPLHESTREELRQHALPQNDVAREEDRRAHPEFPRIDVLSKRISTHRLALQHRRSELKPEPFQLKADGLPAEASALTQMAWPLVRPDRKEFGREAEGLALAQRALDVAENAGQATAMAEAAIVLSRALFALGRDDEAKEASARALSLAPAGQREQYEEYSATLDGLIEAASTKTGLEEAAEELALLEAELAELKIRVTERQTWQFPETKDGRQARWWHTKLTALIDALSELEDEETGLLSQSPEAVSVEHGWSVPRRLALADRLSKGLGSEGEWADDWSEASRAIREHPQYGELELAPQVGLVPIGPDPDSGLWEFWHVASGERPTRAEHRELILTEQTGLVFVLVPAGRFWMGASADPNAEHNYDEQAEEDVEGPVHEVTLSAYFLSKYEMTRGQWERLTGVNPNQNSNLAPQLLKPVAQVSWRDAMRELPRMGLGLPTEAQWENACRAGTETPWWTGPERDSLIEHNAINVADQAAARVGARWTEIEDWPELDDGSAVAAPVGTYAPNPWGFHEVHGNLWEWCLDGFDHRFYAEGPRVDPVAPAEGATRCVRRGGGFYSTAALARSANRNNGTPWSASDSLGIRPARAISEGIH